MAGVPATVRGAHYREESAAVLEGRPTTGALCRARRGDGRAVDAHRVGGWQWRKQRTAQLTAHYARHSKGQSRRFAYIGYKSETDAQRAISYFNGTFIDTSRIAVEQAKAVSVGGIGWPLCHS